MPRSGCVVSHAGWRAIEFGAAWAVLCGGCAPAVQPFRDEMHPAPLVTTASVEAARAYEGEATVMTRTGPGATVSAKAGGVRHFVHYYEDPVVEDGSDDGRMAWTAEDYVMFLAWQPARFLVETVTWPVQAIVEPPWRVHVSDGTLDHTCWDGRHDAVRERG